MRHIKGKSFQVSNEFEFPAKIKSQIINYWDEIQDTFVKKKCGDLID